MNKIVLKGTENCNLPTHGTITFHVNSSGRCLAIYDEENWTRFNNNLNKLPRSKGNVVAFYIGNKADFLCSDSKSFGIEDKFLDFLSLSKEDTTLAVIEVHVETIEYIVLCRNDNAVIEAELERHRERSDGESCTVHKMGFFVE